jgi:hypothetical protein
MPSPGVSATAIGEPVQTALQLALARGHRWLRQIESGKVSNLAAIAKAENVDNSYVSRMVNLTTLAPDIQAAILDQTLPDTVSLFDLAVDTPLSWEEQRERVTWPATAQRKAQRRADRPPAGSTGRPGGSKNQ